MSSFEKLVRGRRSVRTYDPRPIKPQDLEKLCSFMENVENPYGLPIVFKLLDAGRQKLSCPVVVGTDVFVGAKMKKAPHLNEAFGYSFERLVLYAQSLGIGTVWIGGTMDRASFEKAMELDGDEVMPCVSPLGYPAPKMSLRETLMRKAIRAEERMPFEQLFFEGSFHKPLAQEAAGQCLQMLEMVRLAPSAVNKQPWRIVVGEHAAHFYLHRMKSFGGGTLDMQRIDMGIALCHFDLAAQEAGLCPRLVVSDPGLQTPNSEEYIATYEF